MIFDEGWPSAGRAKSEPEYTLVRSALRETSKDHLQRRAFRFDGFTIARNQNGILHTYVSNDAVDMRMETHFLGIRNKVMGGQ